jgi:cobalamin biosynthesis Mg chelatase CobN
VYDPVVPTVPHEESSPGGHKNDGSKDGGTEDGKAESSNLPPGRESGDGGPSGGEGNTGQTNQGSAGNGEKAGNGSKAAAGEVGGAKPLETVAQQTSSKADDGSSSPLVPILIAIAVLAAISIGAFLYRQRRQQDPGSPISPKAS